MAAMVVMGAHVPSAATPSLAPWQEGVLSALRGRRQAESEALRWGAGVEALLSQVHHARREAAGLRGQVEEYKAQAASALAVHAASTPGAVTVLQSRLLSLQEKVTELLREQAEGAKTRLAVVEASHKAKEEAQAAAAEAARVTRAWREATEELEAARKAVREREAQLSTTAEELLRSRQAVEGRAAELESLRRENASLLAQVMAGKTRSVEEINAMNATVVELRRDRDRLTDSLGAAQSRILDLTKALAAAAEAASSLPLAATATAHSHGGSSDGVLSTATAAWVGDGGGGKGGAAGGGASTPIPPLPATPQQPSPASLLSWIGRGVTGIVAAAKELATDAGSVGTSGTPAPVGTAKGGGAPAGTGNTAASVAGLMSDYVFASLPIPTHPQAIIRAHGQEVNAVRFHDTARLLASGSSDGNVGLWDTSTGARHGILYTASEGAAVVCLEFHGTVVVGGCTDRAVRVWDLTTQRLVRTLTGHNGRVHSLVYVPPAGTGEGGSASSGGSGLFSRGLVLSGGSDRVVKVWDVRDGRCARTVDCKSIVNGISLSSDGLLIATANQDSVVRLFDVRMGAKVEENATAHTAAVTSVAFSRTDTSARLLTASRDNTLRLLDGKTLEPLKPYLPTSTAVGGSTAAVVAALHRIRAAAGTGSSGDAAVPSGGDGEASSIGGGGDVGGGSIIMRHPGFRLHANWSRAVWNGNGSFVAAGSGNGCIYTWSTEAGTFEREIGPPGGEDGTTHRRRLSSAGALSMSSHSAGGGGHSRHSTSRDRGDSISAADMGSGDTALLDAGPHDGNPISAIDWSFDGRYLASGDEKGVVVVWGE